MSNPYPSAAALGARLHLDHSTGVLTWCDGPRRGLAAATDKGRGYVTLRFNGRALFAHRVVFILATGRDPHPLHIDHINGDRSDNRPTNLRALTNAENVAHRHGVNRNNTSGHLGVSWARASSKWAAYVKRNGTRHYLGLFDSADRAAAARQRFLQEITR